MKRHCLALDLRDDPEAIEQYDHYHRNVWPEVEKSLAAAGIRIMEIYRIENRLFMIIEVDDTFSFEKKARSDHENSVVMEWESIMAGFQQPLPGSRPGKKWREMKRVYRFDA